VSENDWKDYEEILQDTAVTERLLLKENGKRELSFPSLKMAEFFAGLYLGRYCDERVVHELQPQIGMGEWNNIWRFVAELPETSDGDGRFVGQPNSLPLQSAGIVCRAKLGEAAADRVNVPGMAGFDAK
jgi:hypothetical protein